MKIIIYIRDFWPLKGGLQYHCLRLAQELIKSGVEVKVVTRFIKKRFGMKDYFINSENPETTIIEGVPTEVIGHNWIERLFLLPVFKIMWRRQTHGLAVWMMRVVFKNKLRRAFEGADIIHFDGASMELMGFVITDLARQMKLPLFIQPSMHAGQWGDGYFDLKLYRHAQKILCHTEFEKGHLAGLGVKESTLVIVGNGIDDYRNGNETSFRQNTRVNTPFILFLGRKEKDKGYDLLKESAHIVHLSCPDLHFVFIGPNNPYAEKNESNDDLNYIHEFSDVTEDFKHDALAACEFLCVPSEGESFGLVFLEAALYGKTSIARDLSVLEELLGDSIVRVGQRQPNGTVSVSREQLAQAIVELHDNKQREIKLGLEAKIKAESFTWPHAVERFQEVYNNVLRAKC